jgi:hypothetical protein
MKNKHKKSRRRRIDVNVEELDQIVDRARQAPLSQTECDKLKTALHTLVDRLQGPAKTEKLGSVFAEEDSPAPPAALARAQSSPGHGRNGFHRVTLEQARQQTISALLHLRDESITSYRAVRRVARYRQWGRG